MSLPASETFTPSGWTWFGLFLVLAPSLALPLLFITTPTLSSERGPGAEIFNSVGMWALMAATAVIVIRQEKASLASIGLRPVSTRAVAIGLGGAALLIPISELLLIAFDSDVESEEDEFDSFPIWLQVFALVTAGVTEEWLFRGYAITRLTALTGSRIAAAVISIAAFTIGHLPFAGFGSFLSILIFATTCTLVFLWTRNLLPGMVLHATYNLYVQYGPYILWDGGSS